MQKVSVVTGSAFVRQLPDYGATGGPDRVRNR